jgi:2-polyprenyl-6-methoxyphenol hydroxylase-like FAD-dependent oxidoreductase
MIRSMANLDTVHPDASNLDVLICGAGVAGCALARLLGEGGHRVTVVERAPSPRPGGQAVDLRGAGRTVAQRMGLLARVRELALDQRGIAWVDARGRVRAQMPVEAFGGEGIVSEIEILRGDLVDLLYEASRPAATYRFDDTVTALRQDDDGVTVSFESAPTSRFDLVVGADGPHSAVRSLAFGPESSCVRPLDCATAWFTTPADPSLNGWFEMFNAPGGYVASLRPGRLPDQAKAALSLRGPMPPHDPRGAAGQKTGQKTAQKATHKEWLAERFTGLGWKVPWLLAAMRDAEDFSFDHLGQVHLDRWSAGRVVLLGDAAHCTSPLTGLGTSTALVGAYLLAGELRRTDGDHRTAFTRYEAAFTRYEQALRPFVAQAQQLPPGGVGGFAPRRALMIRARELSMRSMTRWPMRPLMERQFAKAADIDLPS